jgi:hypothetical protein
MSSAFLGTPPASWVTELPPAVQTYFQDSLEGEQVVAATTSAGSDVTTPGNILFSTSSFSLPSYTPISYSAPSVAQVTNYAGSSGSYSLSGGTHLTSVQIAWIVIGGLILLGALGSGLMLCFIICHKKRTRARLEAERIRSQQQQQQQQPTTRAVSVINPTFQPQRMYPPPPQVQTVYVDNSMPKAVELSNTPAYPTQIELPAERIPEVP